MASVVAENWEYMEKQEDDFESLEFSHVNQGLLMSLLDETQVDDCDDERLTKVIQSLEAEIKPDDSHDSNEYWNDESSGQDWSMPHDFDDHNWMDMEFAPSADMEKYWSFENSREQGIAGMSVLDQWTDDETHFVSSVVNDNTSSFV
ncbi:uncharacterized protein [Primulina huaijiensis]|uniref:uncharacterized protein n=1 Tax=Primulina huaijiensis TaxID=1492673 RepID=UPI003CC71F13